MKEDDLMQEPTIDELIQRQVAKELSKYNLKPKNEPRVCKEWIEFRKEIEAYCKKHASNVRWTTTVDQVYQMLRFVLRIHRIDEMNAEQVLIGKKIFHQVCNYRLEAFLSEKGKI